DGDDLLVDDALGRGLARLRVPPVDEDGAGSTETRPTAELRPGQPQGLPENPEQWRFGMAVVNLHVRTVDDKPHLRPAPTRTCARCCIGLRFVTSQVRCPHRMMVIFPAGSPAFA